MDDSDFEALWDAVPQNAFGSTARLDYALKALSDRAGHSDWQKELKQLSGLQRNSFLKRAAILQSIVLTQKYFTEGLDDVVLQRAIDELTELLATAQAES